MSATQQLLRFGPFELNLDTQVLRKSGTPIKLPPQPFRLLAMLASRSGQVVSREEIQQRLWGEETYVDFEHGMNKCIKQIRTVLGDNPDLPAYIETLPRQGYRFMAPVVSKNIPSPPPQVTESKSGELLRMPLVVDSPAANRPPVLVAPKIEVAPADQAGSRAWQLRLMCAGIVLVLAALIAGGVYWHSRNTTKLTYNDTVVLADLTNRTSDPVFGEALNTPLHVELEQTPFLNVLAADKIRGALQLLNHLEDAQLTAEMAREVCLRTNSKAVIAGSIADAGNHFQIDLRGIDCQSGKVFAQTQLEAADRHDVVRVLGVAGGQLRRQVGEPGALLRKFNQPLEEATSSSLEALRFLTEGMRRHASNDSRAAVSYYKRAVDLDRQLFLIPGLFLEPAIQQRFNTEPPNKPRAELKRFTAKCKIKVIGELDAVKLRWQPEGTWEAPKKFPVATVSNCAIEG